MSIHWDKLALHIHVHVVSNMPLHLINGLSNDVAINFAISHTQIYARLDFLISSGLNELYTT